MPPFFFSESAVLDSETLEESLRARFTPEEFLHENVCVEHPALFKNRATISHSDFGVQQMISREKSAFSKPGEQVIRINFRPEIAVVTGIVTIHQMAEASLEMRSFKSLNSDNLLVNLSVDCR